MSCVTVAPSGPEARAVLWAAVEDAQRADPLAPVTVVVPSPYAGLALRHELAGHRGLVNVHFVALNRVAELLGAPFLSDDRRPLTTAVATEATRLALLDVPAAGLAPTPRTVDAVTATLREAIRCGITPAGALGAVAAAGRARLTGYYDDEDQLHEAAQVVDRGAPGLADVGRVVWFLPDRITPGSAALARALTRAGRLEVVAAATGDPAADRVIAQLAATANEAVRPPPGLEPPTATQILVAPDHDTEVRAVARQIVGLAAAGTPFHRVAVTFTTPEPYLRLVHERFAAAGITMAGPAGRRLAETAAGRVVAGILRAIDQELSRDSIIDLLASAPLRPELDDGDTAWRWDLLSRRAGVIGGRDEWETRLAASTADGTVDGDDADELLDVVRALASDDRSWSGRAGHARAVVDLLLGPGCHLPPEEMEALDQVHSILRSLGRLDELDPGDGDAIAFGDAVAAALDDPFGRVGTAGTGVLVAPMASIGGAAFDVVFVLGLSEGTQGSAALDDPLLPGHGLAADRRDRLRGAYLAALATAPRRVVSLPRADLRAERGVMPSPWAIESAVALAGRPVTAAELLAPTSDAPWLEILPSLEALVATAAPGPDEARLGALVAWRTAGTDDDFPIDDPALRLGLEVRRARAGPVAGPWDGVVGALDGLAPDDQHPFSATRLETWATCPFRYFLRTVLAADEEQRPEAVERMEPRVQGWLVHEVLAEFLAAHPAKRAHEPWSDAERSELTSLVERHADRAAARGLVGRPALWAIDRRRILAGTRTFLDVDELRRAERGTAPWLQEVGFGDGDDDRFEPLDLEIGGRRVRLRGRIDRVDRSPDGTRVDVYDYKTGRPSSGRLATDPVAAGELLQPLLYGMVMRREAPDAVVASHYWFTRAGPGATFDGLDVVDDAAGERLHEALGIVTDAIAGGVFPRDPGEDGYFGPDHCRSCDYSRACPADRVRTAQERHVGDPAFTPLRRLRGEP